MLAMSARGASSSTPETTNTQPASTTNRMQDAVGNAAMAEALSPTAPALDNGVLAQLPPVAAPVQKPTTVPSGTLGDVYRDHQKALPGMDLKPTSGHKWAMDHFKKTYEANAERYAAVAAQTGVPPQLIAALHYRESSMKFDTYLHQGDKLGKKAVNHPNNIPIMHDWETAAIHALNQKKGIRDELNMDEHTTDPAALATYAERYNGLGYHNRGKESPYVYSGTDVYKGGKYVRDGVYNSKVWDQQPGVMALMASLQDENGELPEWATPQTPDQAWTTVAQGDVVVKHGQRGAAVEGMQTRLAAAGFEVDADGDFGDKTKAAIIEFQKAHGLKPDGVVGKDTAAALEAAGGAKEPATGGGSTAPATAPAATPAAPAATPTAPAATPAPATAKPDPWAAAIAGGRTLERGAKGGEVTELQKRLAAAGHDLSNDGDFGPKTRAAVMAFQRANGLRADGIVGPKTVALLMG